MAGAHLSALRRNVSTKVETSYGVRTADADLNKNYYFGDDDLNEVNVAELEKSCGTELFSSNFITAQDATLPFNTSLRPDAGQWIIHKVMGGGSAYSVTGSGPYTHVNKKIPEGTYQQKSFTLMSYDKGVSLYWKVGGGIIPGMTIAGSLESKRLTISGVMEFDGNVAESVSFTEATCVAEDPFRFGDCTFTIGQFGGAAVSGLKHRGFSISYDNSPETLDEAERTGKFVASRERGDRVATVDHTITLDPGETLYDYFKAGTAISYAVTCTHNTAGYSFGATMLKGVIQSITYGRATRARKRTATLRIYGLLDSTSTTTDGQSPIYFTMANGVPTYEA